MRNGWDLFYPPCCPLCHQILQGQEQMICVKCRAKLRPIGEPRCKKCGKPLEDGQEELCRDCRVRPHWFEEGRGIFLYDQKMKDSIIRYKYGGRRIYGEFYIRALALYGESSMKLWRPQAVFPVPMEKRKKRKRGFNQSEQLALGIGRQFGIPVCSDWIQKVKKTKSQKKLNAAERRRNLQEAFRGKPGVWKIERALIVDDVYTTGATIDAVAGELKKHGVKKVYFLTICTGFV